MPIEGILVQKWLIYSAYTNNSNYVLIGYHSVASDAQAGPHFCFPHTSSNITLSFLFFSGQIIQDIYRDGGDLAIGE